MSDFNDEFFGDARSIRLTPEEKNAVLGRLRNAVRNSPGARHHFSMDERTFLETAKTISLTPRERVTIREFLLSRMRPAPRERWWLNPFKSFASVTASFLILSIAGASVSYAAESAMPGDMLYPVKMHVNEKIESSMASTPAERAGVAARHAERRLREAEMLAQKSALDPEKQTMLAGEVQRNVNTIQAAVAALMDEHDMAGAGSISMGLEATLNAHSRLLARLNTEHRGNEMAKLMDTVHEARMNIEESTIAANMQPSDMTKVSDIAVTSAITSAKEEIGQADALLRGTDASEAADRLTKARDALAETDSGQGLSGQERLRFARTALRKAKEAALIATMPEPEASGGAPAVMMMKANLDARIAPVNVTTPGTTDAEDTHFDATVRMRMTEKKLKHVRDSLERHRSDMADGQSDPVETRVNGSQQLMDMAKIQMNQGNMNEALDASDAALKHANEASKELKDMMPDSED